MEYKSNKKKFSWKDRQNYWKKNVKILSFWRQMSKSYVKAVAEKTSVVYLKPNTKTSRAAFGLNPLISKAYEWNHGFVSCLSEILLFLFWSVFWFPSPLVFSFWNDTTWTYHLLRASSVEVWIHAALQEFHCLLQLSLGYAIIKPTVWCENLLWETTNPNYYFKFLFLTFYCWKTKMKSLPILLLRKPHEWDFCKYLPLITALKKTPKLSNTDLLRKIGPRPRKAEDAGKTIKLQGISLKK